jgi:hypothetical protein
MQHTQARRSPLTQTTTPSSAPQSRSNLSEESSPKQRLRRGALDYTIGGDSTTSTSTSCTSSPSCASLRAADRGCAADAIHIDSDSSDSSGLSAITTTSATTVQRRVQRHQRFERCHSAGGAADVRARPTHPGGCTDDDEELTALVAEYRQSLSSRALRTTPVKERRYRPAATSSTTAAEELTDVDEHEDSARCRRRVRARARSNRARYRLAAQDGGGAAVSLLAEVRALLREMRSWLPADGIALSSACRRCKFTRAPASAYRRAPTDSPTTTVPTTPIARRRTDAAPADVSTLLFQQMASIQVALEQAIGRDASLGPDQQRQPTAHSTSAPPTPPSAPPVAAAVTAPPARYEQETQPSAACQSQRQEELPSSVDAAAIRCMYPELFCPLAPAQPSPGLASFAAEPTERAQPSTMPSPAAARQLTAGMPPAPASPPLSPSMLAVRCASLQYDDWKTKRATEPTETVVISQPTSTASLTGSSASPDNGPPAQAHCV